MEKREKKFKGHVISHTHWDRAWYWPFQKYRIRLIQTVDHLIDILINNPKYKSFTLDGQTIVLEDYLEVKPEKEEILKQLIKDKRIYVGPWYILPDEFLVSGESIVRNLILGSQIAAKFGNIMNEGYVPDPFGHIAQLPQILNGFGIGSFIFYRGYSLDLEKAGTEFMWKAPDGSEVLSIYLKNGYCHFSLLGFDKIWGDVSTKTPDNKLALERSEKEFKDLSKYAHTNQLIFANGCDHVPPQKEIPSMLEYINENQDEIEMIHSNFPAFIDSIKNSDKKLETYSGELTGEKYAFILLSVYSTRMYLKQMNNFSQNLFEKYVEPISVFNKLLGGYNYQPSIWTGWKLILQNHPHDDVCGAGADEIHRQMVSRFEQAVQIGEYIVNYSFNELSNSINTSSIPDSKPIVIFNPYNWTVSDYLSIDLLFEKDDKLAEEFKIVDKAGNEIDYQVISSEIHNTVEILKECTYRKIKIAVSATEIPGIGYKTIYVIKGKKRKNIAGYKPKKNQVENEFYTVTALSNGTFDVYDKISKKTYHNLNLFEDTEDIGDEYTYSYAATSQTVTSAKSKAKISISNNSVFSEIRISLKIRIPDSIHTTRSKRNNKLVDLPIESCIRLTNGVNRIDVTTTIKNDAKDHRIRSLFPTEIISDTCTVDGHYDFVERNSYFANKPTQKKKFEYYATRNQQKFVSVSNGKFGLTIANKGLPEYEIVKEKGKAVIALTLLRSVGALSHPDLITRIGNAGPMLSTPEAQCLGTHVFEYSIIPHKFDLLTSKSYKNAYQFNSGLIPFNVKWNEKGKLKDTQELILVDSDDIIISAIKKSEKGDNLVIRFFNPSGNKQTCTLSLFKEFRKVFLTNLKEEYISELEKIEENKVKINFAPYKIVTLLFEF
jgi:mannosylglycerate hydrolase